ncbi:11818_t:CDS:2, partial [Racocetra persica]
QRLFDIASYVYVTNDWMGYEDCKLKGIEQVDNNEINKRVTDIVMEIDKIERKNVKVSSVNDDEMGDKKSEDSSKQNYEANNSENCYKNEIGISRFGNKYEKTIRVRNISIDQLNQ